MDHGPGREHTCYFRLGARLKFLTGWR